MEFYLHTTTFDPSNQEVPITVHVEIYEQEYCLGYCLRTNRSDTIKETIVEVLAIYDEAGEEIKLPKEQEDNILDEVITIYSLNARSDAEQSSIEKDTAPFLSNTNSNIF